MELKLTRVLGFMVMKVNVIEIKGILDQEGIENKGVNGGGGTHLRAVGGRGRRGRGSELPALTTGSLAAVFLSHTGWDLHQRETTDKRKAQAGEGIDHIRSENINSSDTDRPRTFQRGVSEALGARWPSGEHVRPHVGRRDGRSPIPRRQLGLRLQGEKEADGRYKAEEVSLFHAFSIIHKQQL